MVRSMPFLLVLGIFCWRLPHDASEAQPATVKFELGNGTGPPQILNNNSVVDILSIGDAETGGNPLVCTTQFTPCCAELFSRAGNWYYPNGTKVPVMGTGYSFYRIRRNSGDGVLGGALLNRRFGAMGPTGIYSCIMLDSNGVNQTLYIGLYTSDMIQTITTEELITTRVAATAQTTTTVEATTDATTVATTAEATSVGAMTEATAIITATSAATNIPGTDEATTSVATTQGKPAEVSTTEEPTGTDNTTNKTNTMSPNVMQTTKGLLGTSGDGTVLPTTDVLKVICDRLPQTSENDPLLIMVIVEGVIIAILIVILTVVTVAFLHWRQKRKTGLYNLYAVKNPMVEHGGSALEQRGGTLISGNVAYFSTKKSTGAQKGGTLMANNVAYVTQGADQWRKPEEMETSIYVDMDKEDRMLRKTFQKIDTPVLRNQSKGHDPNQLADTQ